MRTGKTIISCYRAFTLLETLTVMALIALIFSLSTLALNSVTTAATLTRDGDELVNFLTSAQQISIAQNSQVEVRLYKPDLIASQNWTLLLTRAFGGNEARVIEKPFQISQEIAFSSQTEMSTLIGHLEEKPDREQLLATDENQVRNYYSFKFLPNGSTNLPSEPDGDTWHLSLVLQRDNEKKPQQIPNNFYTVRVDPFTGSIRTFRP